MESTICLFGDSITWGAWDPEHGGWGGRLRSYFEANNDIKVYNCGVTGETTADLLKRFEVECIARKPQILILAIGINDSRYINTNDNIETPLDEFQNNFQDLLEKAKKHTNKIIVLGLTKVNEKITGLGLYKPTKFYTEDYVKKYDATIKEICKNKGVLFLEMYDLLKNEDLEDGLHPNPQGHKKMFLRIKDFLLNNKIV